MKFTERMQTAINGQVNLEMWSAHLYLSMSMYFAQKGLNGFAHWYRKQYEEELEHAHDMMQYIITRGGKVELAAVAAVPTDFEGPESIAQAAYDHECHVSASIEDLVRLASEEKDMASQDFFWKYIREQVEEEASASGLLDQIKMANGHAIIYLDRELANR